MVVAPPVDKRNTELVSKRHPPAILTPAKWGVVLPFRWVEIEGWPGELRPDQIVRRAAFASNWDVLNQGHDLCRCLCRWRSRADPLRSRCLSEPDQPLLR